MEQRWSFNQKKKKVAALVLNTACFSEDSWFLFSFFQAVASSKLFLTSAERCETSFFYCTTQSHPELLRKNNNKGEKQQQLCGKGTVIFQERKMTDAQNSFSFFFWLFYYRYSALAEMKQRRDGGSVQEHKEQEDQPYFCQKHPCFVPLKRCQSRPQWYFRQNDKTIEEMLVKVS